MAQKESDDSIDYGFISKYIKEDFNDAEGNLFRERFETKKSGATEVFSSIGQGESYSQGSGNNSFKNRYNKSEISGQNYSDEEIEVDIPIESESDSTPVTEAKKEFLENLKDESLSVDTCSNVNKDWGRK